MEYELIYDYYQDHSQENSIPEDNDCETTSPSLPTGDKIDEKNFKKEGYEDIRVSIYTDCLELELNVLKKGYKDEKKTLIRPLGKKKITIQYDRDYIHVYKIIQYDSSRVFVFDFKDQPYKFKVELCENRNFSNFMIESSEILYTSTIEVGNYIVGFLLQSLYLYLESPTAELLEGGIHKSMSYFRTRTIKEELMAKAWHPSRVNNWLLAGLDVEDM